MSEKDLCISIHNALNRKRCNTWYIVKIIDGDKVAIFEAIVPTKGNIKVRKPFKKSFENKYFYNLYRITNKLTLHDMGIVESERPKESELIVHERV